MMCKPKGTWASVAALRVRKRRTDTPPVQPHIHRNADDFCKPGQWSMCKKSMKVSLAMEVLKTTKRIQKIPVSMATFEAARILVKRASTKCPMHMILPLSKAWKMDACPTAMAKRMLSSWLSINRPKEGRQVADAQEIPPVADVYTMQTSAAFHQWNKAHTMLFIRRGVSR